MHSTTFLFLAALSGLGVNGSPLVNEKRQLIPFPQNFPFQNLSGDQAGALSAIQNSNLGGFCSQLLGSGGATGEDITEDALNNQSTPVIHPRQSANYNSNSNQGGPGNSNSYSYSSSNNGNSGDSQSNVNYNLNGVTVPQPLTNYQPNTIRGACGQFLGNNGGSQNPTNPAPGYNYISTGINGTTILMNETSVEINSTAAGLGGTTIDIGSNDANGTTVNINNTSIEINNSGVVEINENANSSRTSVPVPISTPSPTYGPPPIASGAPLPVPSNAAPGLNPGIYFQNAFYGSGSDSNLNPIEQPGLPAAPYVPGQFHAYRYACAAACAHNPAAFAFTVKTDFRTNLCDLVIGETVKSSDIVPVQGAQAGSLHLEAWNKYQV